MISVSIVTFNNEFVIGRCLESLLRFAPPETRVVVVDNLSTDRTPEIVRELVARHPGQIELVINSTNAGYGRGHNLALSKVAGSDQHLICNPDILFHEPVFEALVGYLESHPDVGMVTPRVLNEDRTVQPVNKRWPTVLDLFLRRFLPGSLQKPFARRLARYEMRDVGYDREVDVPFVSGCFMFCRTELLKRVGGFDDRYFMYFEDCDLARKFQSSGWRTMYVPSVSVVHLWARAAHKSKKFAVILAVNGVRYFNKWGWKLF